MASSKPPANSGRETPLSESGSALASTADAHVLPRWAGIDRAIFRRDGEYWTLGYGDKTVRLKHIKELAYIRYLLINPGADIHALELARIATPAGEIAEPDSPASRLTAAELKATSTRLGHLGDAGELLDSEAKRAYQRRVVELREQQEEARELGQVARAEKAEGELIRGGLRPLKLQGLSQGEVAQMIRSLSMREPPLALVQLVFDESQGNAFFVEEIYKHLVEEGKLLMLTANSAKVLGSTKTTSRNTCG